MKTALNLANLLSVSRIALIPFFIFAVLRLRPGQAFAIFLIAGITDALDGLIARWANQRTHFGAYLDPIADKLLLTAAFVVLTLNLPYTVRIPVTLTTLAITRDVLIGASALVLYLAEGQTRFPVSLYGKIHTTVMIGTVLVVLGHNIAGQTSLLVPVSIWATYATTIVSGVHYIYQAAQMVEKAAASRAEGRETPRRTG